MTPTPLEDRRANAYRAWREGQTGSLRPSPSFTKPPKGSRVLKIVAIIAAVVMLVAIGSYLAAIPPAHLLIIAALCLVPLGWLINQTKKEKR
jgi:uncharacterized protein (DUF2062 family)